MIYSNRFKISLGKSIEYFKYLKYLKYFKFISHNLNLF
jgi:hypothetical protein